MQKRRWVRCIGRGRHEQAAERVDATGIEHELGADQLHERQMGTIWDVATRALLSRASVQSGVEGSQVENPPPACWRRSGFTSRGARLGAEAMDVSRGGGDQTGAC